MPSLSKRAAAISLLTAAVAAAGAKPSPTARAAAPTPPALTIGVASRCTFPTATDAQKTAILDRLESAGVRWLRMDVDWVWLERNRKGDRQASYLRTIDFCVKQAAAHRMKV